MRMVHSIVRWLTTLPMFRSLRHRNYRLFFFGQLVSLIGTWMQNIGQAWLIYQLTHSAVWLGAIGFLTSVPVLLFSMFGGTVADKISKKRLIIATQTASMVQAFVLALLIWADLITPTIVGVLAFTLGTINAFDMPGRQSFVVEMVGKEDLPNAIALNSAVFNSARMFGPAIGGIVIGMLGVGWCFFLNGISFIAVIIGLLLMNVEERAVSKSVSSVFQSIKESVAYIRSEVTLRTIMMLVAMVTIFGWSYSVMLPIFADRILNIGAIGLGNLLTANGIGALISALTVASFGHKVHPSKFIYYRLIYFYFFYLDFHSFVVAASFDGVHGRCRRGAYCIFRNGKCFVANAYSRPFARKSDGTLFPGVPRLFPVRKFRHWSVGRSCRRSACHRRRGLCVRCFRELMYRIMKKKDERP